MSKFDAFMAELKATASTTKDERLLAIFTEHEATVRELFDSCLYENRAQYWRDKCPDAPSGIEWFGPSFHKAFRQTDVLPTGKLDSEVWNLIAEGSDAFWPAVEEALKADPDCIPSQEVQP